MHLLPMFRSTLHARPNSTKPTFFSEDNEKTSLWLQGGMQRLILVNRCSSLLLHKFEFDVLRNQTVPRGTAQKLSNRTSAHSSIVKGKIVYVHSDKAISLVAIQSSGQRHRMFHPGSSMAKPVVDALFQDI